jgi:tetratricopeptide (TPR) repeat protein
MRLVALLLACLALALASPAHAGDKEKAKEHFFKAKELVEEGALEKAIIEFKKSYEYKPVPLVTHNIAICYDELHQYADALFHYNRYLNEAKDLSKDKKKAIKVRIEKIKKFIGSLKLSIDEKGAEIIIDGKLIGQTPYGVIFLETGEHDLLLRKVGLPDFKKKFTIASGEVTTIDVPKPGKTVEKPEPPVEKPPVVDKPEKKPPEVAKKPEKKPKKKPKKEKKPRKKIGTGPFWAMLSISGATLAAAAVTGGMALKAEKDFNEQYQEDEDKWKPLERKANNLALTTDILIGVGAAAAATTIVLAIVTDFKGEEKSNVSVAPTLTDDCAGVVLSGSF